MHRKLGHARALRREATVRGKRAKNPQQPRRLLPAGRRRRSEPRQVPATQRPPRRARQHERRQVRVQHLRRHPRRTRQVRAFGPQPIAHARADSSCASPALLGAVPGKWQRDEARHPRRRREPRNAHEPRVDDASDAFDRHGGLGDGSRQYHLAPAARCEDAVLLFLRQGAVQRQDFAAGAGRHRLDRAPYLALAGKERQYVAGRLLERARYRGGHGHVAEIARLDGEHAPLRAHDFRVRAKVRGDLACVKGGGHDEHPKVRTKRAADLERKREREVALQRTLVELVEHDEPDAAKLGVGEKPLREQALGDDLQPCGRGYLPLEPHLVAHRLADCLAAAARDVRRAVPRGEPARLQHDDAPAAKPRLVEERGRHARRLAAAGRRRQDDHAVRRKGAADLWHSLFYGKHAVEPIMPQAAAKAERCAGRSRSPTRF